MMSARSDHRVQWCGLALFSIMLASCGSIGEPSASDVIGDDGYPIIEASAPAAPEYPIAEASAPVESEYPVAGAGTFQPANDGAESESSEDSVGGNCLSDRFLFAGFMAEISSPRGLIIDWSVEPWPHLVVDLGGGADAVFDLGPQASQQGVGRIEVSPGIADELESLFDDFGDRGVHLIGRGFPPGDSVPSGSVLVELIDDEIHAYSRCSDDWQDVTAEMALAVRALDAEGPLDAVSKVINGTYDTGQTFAQAWLSAENLGSVPWDDRAPTDRAYADPDVPEETLDKLIIWRVHIYYPDVTVDGTVNFSLCARQDTALTGSCFPFGSSLLSHEVVLEALVDPDLPIEIFLLNHQSGDAHYDEPLATLVDPASPTILEFTTTLDPGYGGLDAATAAKYVDITVSQSTAELLADLESAGLEIVGDLGPFRTTQG